MCRMVKTGVNRKSLKKRDTNTGQGRAKAGKNESQSGMSRPNYLNEGETVLDFQRAQPKVPRQALASCWGNSEQNKQTATLVQPEHNNNRTKFSL